MITFEAIKRDEAIRAYIKKADAALAVLGYTEHSFAHVGKVADTAKYILETLGANPHTVELAQIAGYTHDIGNVVNRSEHSQSGAIMMFRLLDHKDMPAEDIATVVTAIGNHDEGTGVAVDKVSAALILADKTDVRRSRVRKHDLSAFDIHDRVNYSVESSAIHVNKETMTLTLTLVIDTKISSVMDYFEIFLDRMVMCRKAAEFLGLRFKLNINGQQML